MYAQGAYTSDAHTLPPGAFPLTKCGGTLAPLTQMIVCCTITIIIRVTNSFGCSSPIPGDEDDDYGGLDWDDITYEYGHARLISQFALIFACRYAKCSQMSPTTTMPLIFDRCRMAFPNPNENSTIHNRHLPNGFQPVRQAKRVQLFTHAPSYPEAQNHAHVCFALCFSSLLRR